MSDDPNFSLINMVQRARMLHDQNAKPSQVTAVYWIEAKPRPDLAIALPTVRLGYWLVETDLAQVDDLWARIKQATEDGALGYKSKVSTSPHKGKADQRAIHVCTIDADNAADVQRVRTVLMNINIQPARFIRGDA
jgi:Domain of unknown function (DUF1917)